MTLAPLASIADLQARGVAVAEPETDVVNVYLDVASALVRTTAGTPITSTTSTIELEGDHDNRLHLPGNPITAVSDVSIDGEPVTDWKLASGSLWRQLGWRAVKWSAYGWRADVEPSSVSVTYTHGLPAVPADIIDLVCRLVGQALVSYRNGDVMSRMVDQERIGDYMVKYSDAETGILSLSQPQRDYLAARFGTGPGVVVRSR